MTCSCKHIVAGPIAEGLYLKFPLVIKFFITEALFEMGKTLERLENSFVLKVLNLKFVLNRCLDALLSLDRIVDGNSFSFNRKFVRKSNGELTI
jgi:hypothetical protein